MNDIFKALNDETRRQILELLKEKDRSAGEIAEKFNISKPSISHHLELLKKADLITHEKKGQFIIYSINTSVLDEILTWLIKFQPLFNLKKYEVQLKKGNSCFNHSDASLFIFRNHLERTARYCSYALESLRKD